MYDREIQTLIEMKLLEDLVHYMDYHEELTFDWSEVCGEGHEVEYKGRLIEDCSGIRLFSKDGQLVAEGWLDFIYVRDVDRLLVYWDFIDVYKNATDRTKRESSIPMHVYRELNEIINNLGISIE